MMALRLSLEAATKMGAVHEYGLSKHGTEDEKRDSARDSRNNAIVQSYIKENARSFSASARRLGVNSLYIHLRLLGTRLWQSGMGVRKKGTQCRR